MNSPFKQFEADRHRQNGCKNKQREQGDDSFPKKGLVHEQQLYIQHGAGQQKGHLCRGGHQALKRGGDEGVGLGAQIEQNC